MKLKRFTSPNFFNSQRCISSYNVLNVRRNRRHVVLACPQVAFWTYAGVTDISDLLASVADVCLLDMHGVLRVWRACVDELSTGLSLSLHLEHGTADTRVEAAAVDHYFSSPTENIYVPVCLWTP